MLYIDEKYADQISFLVRNYAKKKPGLYNFSCPICGDSDSDKTKARGYLYSNRERNGLVYKCHNCGVSTSFSNLLKRKFSSVYEQYILEKFKRGEKPLVEEIQEEKLVIAKLTIPKLSELPNEHTAVKWAMNRKLPISSLERLYYAEDFASAIEDVFPGKYPKLPKKEPRIFIPFFDNSRNLIGAQGRALSASKMRYITCRANKDVNVVFGLDLCDLSKRVYVVEGPFDSLFLPNGIAVCSSDLVSVYSRIGVFQQGILVFDNEPRNESICKLMYKAIRNGHRVCIWPYYIAEKDINDMVLSGLTPEKILDIINTSSYCGLEAQLEFERWKRV